MNKILCDACGRDLTCTTNSIDYRLRLTNDCKNYEPGITSVSDLGIEPVISSDAYFVVLDVSKHGSITRFRFLHAVREQQGKAMSEIPCDGKTYLAWHKKYGMVMVREPWRDLGWYSIDGYDDRHFPLKHFTRWMDEHGKWHEIGDVH